MSLSSTMQRRAGVTPSRKCPTIAAPRSRSALCRIMCVAKVAAAVPPSRQTSASELESLGRISQLVPDTMLLQVGSRAGLEQPKAATVSYGLLKGILSKGQLGVSPYENVVGAARTYGPCLAHPAGSAARTSCQMDRSLVNIGAMLSSEVEGRVATEVDPRLANDAGAMVAKVKALQAQYKELGVADNKLIFRLPATWAGIQAAKQLEAAGTATQVVLVYSLAQGIAAMQAGVSVIQPNVGRVRDWYRKHPGVIRDAKGPREDSGYTSGVDPGQRLVRQLYVAARKFYPKSRVMASGIRTKEDALALAGCDYMVLPAKVLSQLSETPSTAGYNDGLHAAEGSDGVEATLSEAIAAIEDMLPPAPITEAAFHEQLGLAGQELLKAGLANAVDEIKGVEPYFSGTLATGSE